ncbi:MAG: helix-turn-helix transcriptional regulator [Bacteroidetes bacterium]|nr:helix-turn-helix transcriptional regulator [Bacteroidota bacterium]MCB0843664.1 helix-turn-helix transcriptional regulator [Bacteroidota bacterium]MCB0852697.1 helix-turn-helix transcriptional regulator [Bacteroidota bacterium]
MGQRIYLGEFEELILLLVGVLYDDAYAVAIKAELATQLGRNVNISAIHSALRRLEEKGFARSEMGEPTTKRGGRRKRLFSLTQSGKIALDENRTIRNQLWQQIPDISFS